MIDLSKEIDIIKKSGLFDAEWYTAKHGDVELTGFDPAYHYLLIGEMLNRRPSPDFEPEAYWAANPDVKRAGVSALLHYAQSGKNEGRPRRLLGQVEQDAELLRGSMFFDGDWYLKRYAESVGQEDPALHYLRIGSKLGFDPSPDFSTSGYLDVYRDIKAAGVNPLVHFIRSGYDEGRRAKPLRPAQNLNLTRMTPEEMGDPDQVLEFDGFPKQIEGLSKERIVVHVHLYFTDMADEIIDHLRNIRHPFKLLISLKSEENSRFWHSYFLGKLPMLTDLDVRAVPNRGRDVAPWVVTFAEEVKKSTIFCHFHTKQSHHNSAHRGWFRFLGHSIMGSTSVVDGILEMLTNDEKCGVVAPCYYWSLASQPNYGKNKSIVEELHARLTDEPLPVECPDFPAGSFFWARTDVLRPLMDLEISLEEFHPEGSQVDATLAHGVERIMGILPSLSGKAMRMVTVDVAYDLTRYISTRRSRLHVPYVPQMSCREVPPARGDRIALYTCVSGGYETASEMVRHQNGADLHFFTDDPEADVPKGFTRRLPNYINPEPVRTARFVKTHPHVWFQDYDWAIWCDANLYFLGELEDYVEIVRRSGADAGFIAHPVRETVLEESEELINKGVISDRDGVEAQMQRYVREEPGILSSRLIETNFFVCRVNSPVVQKFMRIWWSELNRYSHRDQLAVNFAIEQSGLNWTYLIPEGRSARDISDFLLFAHAVENRQEIINMTKVQSDVA